MRRNSTPPERATATRPRRKPVCYQNAERLRFTIEIESQEGQALLCSRVIAMAEYLLTTPAKAMLAESLYIACAKAWHHNRDAAANNTFLEEETVKRNVGILRAIDFVDGNQEDADMAEELRHLRLQLCIPQMNAAVLVNIDDWKERTSARRREGIEE